MSQQLLKSVEQTDVVYEKAAKAELDKSFDQAFALYISAAQAYLHWAKNHPSDRTRTRSKDGARKCLERAELIKLAKKNELRPLAKDPFSAEEQSYILEKSSKIHNVRFPVWKLGTEIVRMDGSDKQPPLGQLILEKHPDWRRPHEVYPGDKITMASSNLQPQDIIQNVVTDCSVCSSIAICLHHHRKFNSKIGLSCVFPNNAEGLPVISPTGEYSVRFCINGTFRRACLIPIDVFTWDLSICPFPCQQLAIDDLLPFFPDGTPISVTTAGKYDIWPSLLEKAFMKVMDGYDFPGSNSSIDIHIMTGWIPEHLEIRSSSFESEKVWKRISRSFKQGLCILTVGTGQREQALLRIGETNLLPTHSYAVLDVCEKGADRWLSVLNPWNGDETHGADDLYRRMKSLELNERSAVLDVSWNDVLNVFDGIYLNWDPTIFSQCLDFHGQWKPRTQKNGTAEGTHYYLRVDVTQAHAGDEIWVLLTRHFVDKTRRNQFISVHAQQEEVLQKANASGSTHYAFKGSYTSSTRTLTRLALDNPLGNVAIVASYEGEFEDSCFTVQVYSQAKVAWVTEPYSAPYSHALEGTLSSKYAGGNSTYPTFMNNPQYLLKLHSDRNEVSKKVSSDVSVRLVVEGPRNIPFNAMLVWYTGGRVFELRSGDILANSGAYSYGIAQATASLKYGEYCIIVSAFEPRHRGSFTLRVESSARMELEALPAEGAGMFCKTVTGAWCSGSDGGGPSFGKYRSNPIYDLEVGSAMPIRIRLQLTRPSPAIALNVTVFSSLGGKTLGQQIATSGPYSDSISGVITPKVNVPPGKYLVVASCYDPGIHADFQMLLYSKGSDIEISRAFTP